MKQNKVLVIDILDPKTSVKEGENKMLEVENLVFTYGGMIIVKKYQKKQIPNYKTYIGSGKLEELKIDIINHQIDLVIVNNLVKPQQLFNLEEYFRKDGIKIKIWDKVDLILKIFEKHAKSQEAKLQIELASLRHLGPRIFGMGLELSRQGGGIGTRGQGETNTEIMKRHLFKQEQKIKEKLEKVQKRQESQRLNRKKQGKKSIAIVGYTNAGKSQLLNSLTQKKIDIENKLFATLDTRISEMFFPEINNTLFLSDTIGFIQDLPPQLIKAFRSTLEEAMNADLLLHVFDYSDPFKEEKIKVVLEILKDLNKDKKIPQIFVANKIDLIEDFKADKNFIKEYQDYSPVFISALNKINFKELRKIILKKLNLI